ncbi:hypothetical protein SLS53_001248 [Cytospora paraplurivora]|uniref:Deacetylase complex subunit n=1 Tax=Cytospora paraplurivora TaxID=2898453 RepID=A0AAN9YKY5_9PEZI
MAANTAMAVPHEAAPPARNESKRERKRQLLQDRLQQMSESFSRGRDSAYREQLQKIQLDTNLIMRVDPYGDRPLEGLDLDPESALLGQNTDPTTARTLLEMAGPRFRDWVHDIEDLVEERDYELTKQKLEYERKCKQHRNVHDYKVLQAKREHHSLASTVRDRLINTITSKKYRLSKEKEALEISDASALLLHPNQFSMTNPASPGGTHGKRATRLRREMEEMPGFSENKKRKRNGDDDGSPVPQRRALDTNNTTPVWQNDRLRFGKTNGPVYSIDKLFTDKELSMTYNTAALAAHKYMLRHKSKDGVVTSPPDSGPDDHEDGDDGIDSMPSAPAMERQVSHATRSTRGGTHNPNFYDNKLVGIEALANFELPGNLERLDAQEPKLPPIVPAPYNKAKPMTEASGPAPLTTDDAQADLQAIAVLRQYEDIHGVGSNLDVPNGGRRILEAVAPGPRDEKFVAYLQGDRPSMDDLRAELKVETSNLRVEPGPSFYQPPAFGGMPMSRQSSGGVAMSRQGSSTKGSRRRG